MKVLGKADLEDPLHNVYKPNDSHLKLLMSFHSDTVRAIEEILR